MKKWILFFTIIGFTLIDAQPLWETINLTGVNVTKIVQVNGNYYAILEDGPILENVSGQSAWTNTQFYLQGKGGDAVVFNNVVYIVRDEKVYQFDPVNKQFTEISNFLGDFIHCIEKPDINSLLIGTQNGGVYYSLDNGGTWTSATSNIPSPVLDLFKTSGDTILAATLNGLYYSVDLGQNWTQIPAVAGIPIYHVTGNSLSHYVAASQTDVYSFTLNNLNSFVQGFLAQIPEQINDIILTEKDTVLIAAKYKYPARLMGGIFGSTNFDVYDPNSPLFLPVNTFFYDESNDILLVAPREDVIHRRTGRNWSTDLNLMYLNVNDVSYGVDRSGNPLIFYVSGIHFGYWDLNSALGRGFGYTQYNSELSSVLFINPDSILLGFKGDGLYLTNMDGTVFNTLQPDISVTDLLLLPSGKVLIATLDSGVIRYDLNTNTFDKGTGIPTGQPVFSLSYRDWGSGGNLFAGASGAMVYFSTDEGLTWSSMFITSAGFEGDVLAVWEDQNGNIFAGTRGIGLWMKAPSQAWKMVQNSDGYGRIKAITESVNHELLIGTDSGIKRFEYQTESLMDEVFNDFAMVTSFDISPEGDLLVGYHGGGLAVLHGFNVPDVFVFQPEIWEGLDGGDIVAFDYDLDLDYDILICGADSAGNFIAQLLNKTTTGYQVETNFSIAALRGKFDVADVDNDGDPDLLFAGEVSSGNWIVRIYYNVGGSFGNDYVDIATPSDAIAKFGDFNHDGKVDVFVNGYFTGEGLKSRFYYNLDFRNFSQGPGFSGLSRAACATGDFNMDGFLDVVLMGDNAGNPLTKFYRNDSARTMVEIVGGAPSFYNAKIKVVEVNNDGLPDLIYSGINTNGYADLVVALNNNNFGFTPFTSSNLPFVAGGILETADFDGDGLIDLFISGMDENSTPRSELYSYNGTSFTMITGVKTPPIVSGSSCLVDFDGDGDLDICVLGVDDLGKYFGGVLMNLFNNPTSPPNDIIAINAISKGRGAVEIYWNTESDDKTPVPALQYNIKIEMLNAIQNGLIISPDMHPTSPTFPLVYEKSNSGSTPFHYVRNLPPGDYQASIQVIDNGWQFSNFSSPVQFTVQPWLEPPMNLKGVALANQILLSWSPVSVADFKYYQIYMAEGAGSYVFLDSTQNGLPEDTTFVVKNIKPDTDYKFYVTTVLQTGEVSGPSDTLVIHTPITTIPTPELLHAFPMNGTVQLVWTKSTVSDFNNYNIFVGDSPFNLQQDTIISVRSDTVVQITGLTNGKSYYFAVSITTNASLESPLSNILRKAPGIPEIVTIDAFSIAADSFSVKYIVAPAGNTVTNIALQVAQSQNFTTFQTFIPPVRQVTGDNLSPFSPAFGTLSPNQKYFVRVTGNYDSSGTTVQINSNVSSFLTFPEQVLLEFPQNTSVMQDPVITLSWFSVGNNVIYQLQVKEGDSDFSTGNFYYDLDSITTTSIQLNFDFGRTYYWRVRAKNESGPGEWSDVFAFSIEDAFQQNISINYSLDFREKPASDYGPEDYKLFGVPGDIGDPLRNFMSGSQGSDWRIFYDNGNPTNYLEEDDGSGQFSLGGGRAFWVIATRDVTINATFPAPTVYRMDTVYYTPINIHNGWNIITSPFPYDVPWNAIKSLNNLPQGQILYGYDNGNYYQSGFLKANEGFYFENTTGKSQLFIPHQISFSKLSKTGFRKSSSDLDAFIKIGMKKTSSHAIVPVIIGTAADAMNKEDHWDQHIPVNPFGGEQLFVRTGDDESRNHAYQTWIHSNSNELDEWTLVLTGKTGKTYTLEVTETSLPPAKVAYLINTETSEWFNLANTKEISVTLHRSSAELKVLVGDQQQVASELENFIPVEFKLKPNYPNPFNPTTTFTLEIPERVEVTFEIYNILGKKIKTLYRGTMEKGIRYLTWDARDDAGNEVPAGIYFYQVRTSDGKIRTGKMVYLK
jgi:hypothetical protein